MTNLQPDNTPQPDLTPAQAAGQLDQVEPDQDLTPAQAAGLLDN